MENRRQTAMVLLDPLHPPRLVCMCSGLTDSPKISLRLCRIGSDLPRKTGASFHQRDVPSRVYMPSWVISPLELTLSPDLSDLHSCSSTERCTSCTHFSVSQLAFTQPQGGSPPPWGNFRRMNSPQWRRY